MARPKGSKNPNAGAKPMFATEEELQAKIDEYFEDCPDTKTVAIKTGKDTEILAKVSHPTICGLALHLGFVSRQSIYDYAEKDKFAYIIKKATFRIENEYEKRMMDNPAGSIFALKNMGWRDKQETGFTDKDGNDVKLTFNISGLNIEKI